MGIRKGFLQAVAGRRSEIERLACPPAARRPRPDWPLSYDRAAQLLGEDLRLQFAAERWPHIEACIPRLAAVASLLADPHHFVLIADPAVGDERTVKLRPYARAYAIDIFDRLKALDELLAEGERLLAIPAMAGLMKDNNWNRLRSAALAMMAAAQAFVEGARMGPGNRGQRISEKAAAQHVVRILATVGVTKKVDQETVFVSILAAAGRRADGDVRRLIGAAREHALSRPTRKGAKKG